MRITTDSGTPSLRVRVTKLRRKSWNQTPSSSTLSAPCGSGVWPPSVTSLPVVSSSCTRTIAPLARWKEISAKDVAAFNELVRSENVPALNLSR